MWNVFLLAERVVLTIDNSAGLTCYESRVTCHVSRITCHEARWHGTDYPGNVTRYMDTIELTLQHRRARILFFENQKYRLVGRYEGVSSKFADGQKVFVLSEN